MGRRMSRGWDNFKYEASFKWLQFKDWFGRKWHSFWGVRWNDIRWGRSFFFTFVAVVAYISSWYVNWQVRHTYIPDFITDWIWSGWHWFFWMALVAFWLEEILDAGKDERDKLNPWPKGLSLIYGWIILGSFLMGLLSLIASHDFYLQELRGPSGFEETTSKKAQLEKELAEAEGRSPSGESPKEGEYDPLFDKEEGDDLFSGKSEGERSTSRIKVDLWIESLKEKTWNKIFSKATGVENVDAFWLRFKKAAGWFKITVEWLPCLIFFLIVVIPVYGIDALSSRTFTMLSHFPLLGRMMRRKKNK